MSIQVTLPQTPGFFTSLFDGAKALLQKLLPARLFQASPTPAQALHNILSGGQPCVSSLSVGVQRFDNSHRPILETVKPGSHSQPLTGSELTRKLNLIARFNNQADTSASERPTTPSAIVPPAIITTTYAAVAEPTRSYQDTIPAVQATKALAANQAVQHAIPGYDIISHIAEGGFGSVYKARSQATGELVAVKIFSSASPLIEREYQISQLGGYIVRSRELTQTNAGQPCIVFEYLSGGTLEDRFRRLHTFAEAAKTLGSAGLSADVKSSMRDILVQTADCVSSLAQMGVVHRDLKPINLLLDSKGKLKVIDMGFAHLDHEKLNMNPMSPAFTAIQDIIVRGPNEVFAHPQPVWTESGWNTTSVAGVPEYLLDKAGNPLPEVDALFASPSTRMSEPGLTGDVYSLGVMVAYAIMGSDNIADVNNWLASPTAVRHFCEEWGFSSDLANFILKATDPNFINRYPSNVEAAKALRSALESTRHASSTRERPNDTMYDMVPFALGHLLSDTPQPTPHIETPRVNTLPVNENGVRRSSRYWGNEAGRYTVTGVQEERISSSSAARGN